MTIRVLLPLPANGYEGTEASVPWKVLTDAGIEITFATPDGQPATPDECTVTGAGLGLVGLIFRASGPARAAYQAMAASPAYRSPIRWEDANADDFDAIVVPGGHHQDMRPFLESEPLQALIAELDAQGKLIAAICHGVLLVARSKRPDGKSVLHGHRATTVPGDGENTVWKLCHARVGHERYGKPYDLTAEEEVRGLMASPDDLSVTKMPMLKDAPGKEARGFYVRDGNLLTGRLPHDAWCFASQVVEALRASAGGAGEARVA